MRYSRMLLLTALLALGLAVAACAPQTSTQAPAPTTAAAAKAPAAAQPAAPAAALRPGEFKLNPAVTGNVELWHFWSSPLRRTAIRRVVSICQAKLPNIKITETPKPFGDIWTANIAAVAAGSGMPDVIVEDRPGLVQRATDKIDMSLAELAKRDGIDGSAFWPFTWQEATVNGEPYGLPFETDVRVLYWNKQAFKEVGLDPEKPPTTWAELEAYADKLDKKNPDGSYARIGFHPELGNSGWNVWGRLNGAEYVKDGKPVVNDPKVVEMLDWMKKWYDRYGGYDNFQKFRAGFGAPPNDAFMSGKVAMIVDINGYSSVLNFYDPRVAVGDKTEQQRIDVGLGDAPFSVSHGKPTSWSGGFALSIPRGSKNVDAAWEFIKCAAGTEGAVSWSRDTSAMAANQVAAQDPALTGDPRWQFFLNAMKYSQGSTVVPKYPNWGQEIDNRREKIFKGELQTKAALDEAQKAIDAQMAK
jgi:multiple sugar transport system substrate-binding protein